MSNVALATRNEQMLETSALTEVDRGRLLDNNSCLESTVVCPINNMAFSILIIHTNAFI